MSLLQVKRRESLAALESAFPEIRPKSDRALERLRAYALDGCWGWSGERGMALDLAELVEDLQALRLDRVEAHDVRYYYRSALLTLVADKLDLDATVIIRDALDVSNIGKREKIFAELQSATKRGWEAGVERANQEGETLKGDPLIGPKVYANAQLGRPRFIRAAPHSR